MCAEPRGGVAYNGFREDLHEVPAELPAHQHKAHQLLKSTIPQSLTASQTNLTQCPDSVCIPMMEYTLLCYKPVSLNPFECSPSPGSRSRTGVACVIFFGLCQGGINCAAAMLRASDNHDVRAQGLTRSCLGKRHCHGDLAQESFRDVFGCLRRGSAEPRVLSLGPEHFWSKHVKPKSFGSIWMV